MLINGNPGEALLRQFINEQKSKQFDILMNNETKKRKKAYDLLLQSNINPKNKQRSTGYKTLETISSISSIAQVPKGKITNDEKSPKYRIIIM